MAFFDSLFGRGRKALAARARAAELRGDLAMATELWDEAGQPEEAARVMLLRGEAETDARVRLRYFAHAAKLAPEGTETNKTSRMRRAELLLAIAGDAAISAVARHEVIDAARDLEAIGEPLKAAEAYARAGDKEGQARALQAAGDVEQLEFLLSTEHHDQRVSRAREDRAKDVDVLIASGKRREALVALETLVAGLEGSSPDEAALRERANALRSRRVPAPVVVVETEGARWNLVLGNEVVVGRTEGAIRVASNAVSREHLRIARDGDEIVVRDLESRNGTQLRGIKLAGALPVRDGLELKLGREVTLRVAPSKALEGAVDVEVAGETYVCFLGEARTPIEGLGLAAGSDGWVELVVAKGHAYLGDVELVPRATLLVGDAIATTRRGTAALKIIGR